ncbi:hypothetical protein [Streptosporangium sp. 'caverna']|uniref:hypothetical protein n=1 Tax=Streptosporangium sp. 'caverna' TaxID=2202249 RepID=UPI0013A6BFC3|nr:hypothetical protein [Streptosporangium sp. 'caverna']
MFTDPLPRAVIADRRTRNGTTTKAGTHSYRLAQTRAGHNAGRESVVVAGAGIDPGGDG